jgi:hypothetical protein
MSDPDERRYLADLRAQALELASTGVPADFIKAELGIPRSLRTVQRWINQVHGTRPSRRSIERRDILRSRVAAYMVAHGLDPYYCIEGHRTVRPCAIRELRRDDDLGSLVFVCDRHATVADV